MKGSYHYGEDSESEYHQSPLGYEDEELEGNGSLVQSFHPIRIIVITASAPEMRKRAKIVETITDSLAGRPTSRILTRVSGALGSDDEARRPSSSSFVGFAVNALCSVNLLIFERKKKEFWMLGNIATMLAISFLPSMASAPSAAPTDSCPTFPAKALDGYLLK